MFLASDKPLKEVKSSYEGDINKIEISNIGMQLRPFRARADFLLNFAVIF